MTSLIDLLTLAATAAGSGWLAQELFARLRIAYPAPTSTPTNRLHAALYRLLHAPRYARYTSIALAAIIAGAASGLASWLTGANTDVVLTAALAPIVQQVEHARQKLGTKIAP